MIVAHHRWPNGLLGGVVLVACVRWLGLLATGLVSTYQHMQRERVLIKTHAHVISYPNVHVCDLCRHRLTTYRMHAHGWLRGARGECSTCLISVIECSHLLYRYGQHMLTDHPCSLFFLRSLRLYSFTITVHSN